jgi:hypothetical protein
MTTLIPLTPSRGTEVLNEAAPPPRAAGRALPDLGAIAAAGMPNPSLRLDPALGLVVMEFRDQAGRTATLPTERQLEAYRSARGRPDPTPPPPKPGTPTPDAE